MSHSFLYFITLALLTLETSTYNFSDCVFISGDLIFDITYLMSDNTSGLQSVTVPKDGVSTAGKCQTDTTNPDIKTSEISLQWLTYTLDINFELDEDEDRWHATSVILSYDTSTFPDVDIKIRKFTANTTKQLFSTRKNRSYSCNSVQVYQLFDSIKSSETVKWNTSNLSIVPFTVNTGVDRCSADIEPVTLTKPKAPTTKHKTDPKPPTTQAPAPVVIKGGGGKRTALACTLLSLVFCSGVGFLVYTNRGETPSYLRVI